MTTCRHEWVAVGDGGTCRLCGQLRDERGEPVAWAGDPAPHGRLAERDRAIQAAVDALEAAFAELDAAEPVDRETLRARALMLARDLVTVYRE